MEYILNQEEYSRYLEYKEVIENKLKVSGNNYHVFLGREVYGHRKRILIDSDEALQVLYKEIEMLKLELESTREDLSEEKAKPKSWF